MKQMGQRERRGGRKIGARGAFCQWREIGSS
jgi:hypothetical protein